MNAVAWRICCFLSVASALAAFQLLSLAMTLPLILGLRRGDFRRFLRLRIRYPEAAATNVGGARE